jgi:hypothetical protein
MFLSNCFSTQKTKKFMGIISTHPKTGKIHWANVDIFTKILLIINKYDWFFMNSK